MSDRRVFAERDAQVLDGDLRRCKPHVGVRTETSHRVGSNQAARCKRRCSAGITVDGDRLRYGGVECGIVGQSLVVERARSRVKAVARATGGSIAGALTHIRGRARAGAAWRSGTCRPRTAALSEEEVVPRCRESRTPSSATVGTCPRGWRPGDPATRVTVRRSRYGHAAGPARRAVGVRRNPCRLTKSACGGVRSSPHGALPGSARFRSSALFSAPRVHASTAQLSVRHTGMAERLRPGTDVDLSSAILTSW